MRKKSNYLDVKDGDKIANIIKYCHEHMPNTDYEIIPMTLFPIWYRFKFKCSQERLVAALVA